MLTLQRCILISVKHHHASMNTQTHHVRCALYPEDACICERKAFVIPNKAASSAGEEGKSRRIEFLKSVRLIQYWEKKQNRLPKDMAYNDWDDNYTELF